MVDMYKQVSDATAFVRGDGSRLHSLKALEMALYTMTDGEFYHHVSNGRNDFASWVLHVFKQVELAQKLAQATTRVEMLSVLDSASRVTLSNKNAPAVAPTQKTIVPTKSVAQSQSPALSSSTKTSATVVKTASTAPKSGKSFHHKLKGMFKKGEHPVTEKNANSYQAALATAKINAEAPAVLASHGSEHASGHHRTIHEQINHLDSQLAHLTRHHAHTTAREDVGSALLEESVKERILDFSLGLIVGLMLGFILAKSLGL